MKMHVGTGWIDKPENIEVINPYDGSVVDTVPKADLKDVETAIAAAVRGSKAMAQMTSYERYRLLRRAAELMEERMKAFAHTITVEEGKILTEARMEATRSCEILNLSAEEAKRLYGETIPLDGGPGVKGKFGFTVRVPCGVVLAISPFNFPLHLVCHKVGPALAAGNSVIVKPATDTPLSALKLVELLLEVGFPPEAVQCLTGSGGDIGDALCVDPRVRKITFTGSRDVGEHICKTAGLKKVTMELGSNAPLIVMPDADLEKVAAITATTGYSNAGQVCNSAQRVMVNERIYNDFIEALRLKVEAITTGNPLKEDVTMGPMVREQDAVRVQEWVQDSLKHGAKLLAGGERDGTMLAPTIVSGVKSDMRISRDEIFGPVVVTSRFDDIHEAIEYANNTSYGLSAGIFTQNLDWAMKFIQGVESGNIHVNWGPQWRADLMPYGGLKESGMGKEGPRYAMEEMTESKMVVMHLE